jgi:hypothetical protein
VEKEYEGKKKFNHGVRALHAWLYNACRANNTGRFLIDGLTVRDDADWLYDIFEGKIDLNVPFVGTGSDEFIGRNQFNRNLYYPRTRNHWRITHPIATLCSITLSGDEAYPQIGHIDDAISRVQSARIVHEADGVIVLGNNFKDEYAFEQDRTHAAPRNTRILAIAKSRWDADASYREVVLKGKKPVLGRRLILMNK